ncbi:hypothetical protein [Limnohabitans sp.]|uniref:hypothetical protein n=1 Tax=Limnohabitans sp. TaxID=1907725 RepID=UPI002AFDD400|nr:hypothetical protein [Limnohabitans sp.]
MSSTVLQSSGGISLLSNSDGTLSVDEGGTSTVIRDMGSSSPFMGGGIVAAGYHAGYRVVVFGGGHTWYMNASWQKDSVGPGNASTTQLSQDQINSQFFGISPPVNVPPVTSTVVESAGGVSLLRNSDGTWSAQEAGTTTLIKDMGSSNPTTINNLIAAGYHNGYRVVVFDGGHTWYMNTNWQKDSVGPSGWSTTQLSQAEINADFFGGPAVTPPPPGPSTGGGGGGSQAVISAVVMSSGSVSLVRMSDGSLAAQEGGQNTPIKDMGSNVPMFNGVIAVGYYNGFRVAVFGGGHTWYMNANWQKDNAGPSGVSTTQLSPVEINTVFFSGAGLAVNPPVVPGGTPGNSQPVTSSVFMTAGPVSLLKNSDGTWSVKEGAAVTLIKDMGSSSPTTIANIIAAGYVNGQKVVVFQGGHTWYMNDSWQKDSVGPNRASTTQMSPEQINADFFGGPAVPNVPNVPNGGASGGAGTTSTAVLSSGGVTLLKNSDGTWSAQDGANITLIKDMGSMSPTKISNLVAAAYLGSYRVVVFDGGHTWYMNANWQKDNVGPNGSSTTQLTPSQISSELMGVKVVPTSTPVPSNLMMSSGAVTLYKDGAGAWLVKEGSSALVPIKNLGSDAPVTAGDIIAAGFHNGYRVVVFSNGHTWYMNANWQKASVGPAGADTLQMTNDQINVAFFGATSLQGGANSNSTPQAITSTAVMGSGSVSLHSNSDGTWSVKEGNVTTLIKDMGSIGPTKIGNIIAAGYDNGFRVVVFHGGHTWYMNTNWQKDNVGPSGASTTQLSPAQINANFFGGSPADAPTTSNLVMSNGGVTLLHNTDGTWQVSDGNSVYLIKDMGSLGPTTIPNIVAAGYNGGYREVVFNGGHTWYMNANWQKDNVGPGGASTTQRTQGQIDTVFLGLTSQASALTSKMVESFGGVSLLKNSDGTWFVEEGGQKTLIKDMGGLGPTTISNIIAAGYDNGYRVVVFSGGHTWYVNANWQKDNAGPGGMSTTQLSQAQINTSFFGAMPVTTGSSPTGSEYVGSAGGVTLLKNADSTWTVKEAGGTVLIKDMGSNSPTQISNIVAAGYHDGYRVVVFSGGHTWYMNASWQKDTVGPSGASATHLSAAQISAEFYGGNSNVVHAQANAVINGTSDVNTVVFQGSLTEHNLLKNGNVVMVTDASANNQSMVTNVERLRFNDASLALDTQETQVAGQTALLVGAILPGKTVLDPTSQSVLGAVIDLLDQGVSLSSLADSIFQLPIWDSLTGKSSVTPADIATYLVNNVHEGQADAATLASAIDEVNNSPAEFLTNLIGSMAAQSHVGLVGIQESGLVYT